MEKGKMGRKKRILTGLHYDKYGRTATTSWRLLKFSVQVVSHLSANETSLFTSRDRTFLFLSG